MSAALVLAVCGFAADPCAAGVEAARQRDLDRAEILLKECVGTPSAPVEAFLMLCGVHQTKQNAQALFQTAREGLKRFPEEKRFYLTAATHAGRQKDFAEAIAILEPALKRWPEDGKIRALLGSALFGEGTRRLDTGDNEGAADALRRSVALNLEDAEAYLNLGRALHNLVRFEESLEAFEKVLALNPHLPLARFHRGLALYSLGEFDKAVADLSAEIAGTADYPPAFLIRGLAHLSMGSAAEAVRDLETAVRLMPESAAAQHGWARALIRLDRIAEAEQPLRRAMALDPSDPAPVNTLVMTLNRLGQQEEARALARKAAELARRRRTR